MSKEAVFIEKGEALNHTNGGVTTIPVGTVVPLVSRVAVAATDIEPGALGALSATGVFELPAVNNAAFVAGDALYWDDAAKKLTKVSAGNTPAGWAYGAKAETAARGLVKIG